MGPVGFVTVTLSDCLVTITRRQIPVELEGGVNTVFGPMVEVFDKGGSPAAFARVHPFEGFGVAFSEIVREVFHIVHEVIVIKKSYGVN